MGCGGSKSQAEDGKSAGGGGGGDSGQQEPMVDEQTFMFLTKVKILKRLPPEEIPRLAKKSENIEFKAGQAIINQGDEGNEFFMIKKGTADVIIDGKKVADLKAGGYFGENALLRNEPRAATIKATGDVKALKITRKIFTELGLDQKLAAEGRGAVGGGANTKAAIKPPTPKTDADNAAISKALQDNTNLNTFCKMDAPRIQAFLAVMWKEKVSSNTAIIEQGDMQADYFYVVQSGSFGITKSEGKEDSVSADMAVAAQIGTVSAGGSFGELALLYLAARAATVTAKEDSVVWVISREQFKEVLQKQSEEESLAHKKCIEKCEVFKGLKDKEKTDLAKAMREMTFSKDETIFDQGDKGTQFFLLVEGKVSVIKDGKEVAALEGTATEAQYFGEKALIENAPRAATIKITSATAKTLWIDKQTFEMLLGSMKDLMDRGADGDKQVNRKSLVPVAPSAGTPQTGVIKMKDLKKLGLLGCGGFGAVFLVENTSNGEVYALKELSKGYVVKSGMQASVMSEKNVQMLCDSPFIVRLYETFNLKDHLVLLLELALGGELYATYNKKNLWGKVDLAKFYVTGTMFAFDHLHSKNIIFRDLKPENLLLTDKGKVKLTDMGLAKVVLGKTFTTCGTPDYFAPEIIASKGHTDSVDWWMLGILTFELMIGHPPFESATPMQIYAKVQKGINKVSFPGKIQGDCEAIVKGLCHATPTERLPSKKGGIENIKSQKWFSGFDFKAMYDCTMTPPYIPVVKNKKDAANFSARKEDMPPQVAYKDPGTGWDKEFATSS